MNNKEALVLRSFSAGYGGEDVISDISLVLHQGETLCVVGESGSGKSTLLLAIVGMDPAVRLTGGELIIDGLHVEPLAEKARHALCTSTFGMIFQNPAASFNPIRSYEKQFIAALKSHGKYDPETFSRSAAEVFARLGLPDTEKLLACRPYEMSGGMNQRIAIALALMLGQKILLADEPTSALDASTQLQVALELKKLRDEGGTSQIIVTHNLALAQFLADRIAVIYKGRIVECGSAARVLSALEHEHTRSLIEVVPRLRGGA